MNPLDFKNRKKAEFNIGFLMYYALPLTLIFLVMGGILYFATTNYSAAYLKYNSDLPNNIYAYRAINVCFAYQDATTGRYYPGIIDFSKYDEAIFQKCYLTSSAKSFNAKLFDVEKEINHDILRFGFGASLEQKPYPVTIRYSEGNVSKGILYFGVMQ